MKNKIILNKRLLEQQGIDSCGQHIILCKACIQKLNEIVKED